jgi:hypothetical protein
MHEAIPKRDGPTVNARDSQFAQSPDRSHHVQDRVYGPHFVQVDKRGLNPMQRPLDRSNALKGLRGLVAYLGGRGSTVDHFEDLVDVAAVRLLRDLEIHLLAGDFPAFDGPDRYLNAVKAELAR